MKERSACSNFSSASTKREAFSRASLSFTSCNCAWADIDRSAQNCRRQLLPPALNQLRFGELEGPRPSAGMSIHDPIPTTQTKKTDHSNTNDLFLLLSLQCRFIDGCILEQSGKH